MKVSLNFYIDCSASPDRALLEYQTGPNLILRQSIVKYHRTFNQDNFQNLIPVRRISQTS
jgi:hypothetical protein